MTIIFGIFTLLYGALILSLRVGWNKLPTAPTFSSSEKSTFSILIPFRNEARNLSSLFKSISELNYSREHFEVILIDDASEDSSATIIQKFINSNPGLSLQILKNERETLAPKKDAICTGIKIAKMEYILTTDADCRVPANWLKQFNNIIQTQHSSLIAGPVIFNEEKKTFSVLNTFQDLDFLSLQATSGGAFGLKMPFLCNGANLCYKKSDFIEVQGFQGNETISSGDDVFLLQKFVQHQKKVSYLKNKNAVVFTDYQPTANALFQQRIRWAAKTPAYSGNFSKRTGILVFIMNLVLLLGILLSIIGKFSAEMLLFLFLIKLLVDFVLLYPAAKFFGKTKPLKHYWWCSLLYPFFTVSVAIFALTSEYTWKGRKFKK